MIDRESKRRFDSAGWALLVMVGVLGIAVRQLPAESKAVKWRLYAPCDEAKIVAHDDGSLWFLTQPYSGGQVFWRYDLKTRRLAVTSRLDDPLKGKEPSALNPGKGFCAANPLMFRNRTWVQGDGWVSIPVIMMPLTGRGG